MEFPLKTVDDITDCIFNYATKVYKNGMSTDAYTLNSFQNRIVYPFIHFLEDVGEDGRYIYTGEYYPYHNTNDILVNRIEEGAFYYLGSSYFAKHLVTIEHHIDVYGDTSRLQGFTKVLNGVVNMYNNVHRGVCKETGISILKLKDSVIDEWRRSVLAKEGKVTELRREFGEIASNIFECKREEIWNSIKSKIDKPAHMNFDELEPYFNDYFKFVKDLALFSVERKLFNFNNGVIRKVSIMDDKYWDGHPTNTSGVIYEIKEKLNSIWNKIKYFAEIM